MSDEETNTDEPMLSTIEARVLGTLMEKQLATPDGYPLTLNSVVTGCNQKTSREPVSNYSKGELERCLNLLRERDLIEVEYGSRANRYHQRLSRKLHLDKPSQAVLALMLLRGPQTLNELLNRGEKMHRFDSVNQVRDLLATLLEQRHPIIIHIPKQAGQREDRYTHLLCGEPDLSAWASAPNSRESSADADLLARIEELEEKLNRVMNELGIDSEATVAEKSDQNAP